MYSQSLHLAAIAYLTLVPFTQCSSLVRAQRPSLGPLSSTISNAGKPLTILRSNEIPELAVIGIWSVSELPPTWLRSIEPSNVIALIDAFSNIFSSRPSDEIGKYTTVGPESSVAFANFSTRVVVKKGMGIKGSDCPEAPMKNNEIAEAARLIRYEYNSPLFRRKTEWAWQMVHIEYPAQRVTNCTGVILIQRDLWYEGAQKIQTQPAGTA